MLKFVREIDQTIFLYVVLKSRDDLSARIFRESKAAISGPDSRNVFFAFSAKRKDI